MARTLIGWRLAVGVEAGGWGLKTGIWRLEAGSWEAGS